MKLPQEIFRMVQVIFIVLKMTNLIDWSWWYVWSPMLIIIISIVVSSMLETEKK